MRRVIPLLALAVLAWVLLSRRRAAAPVATIAYDDGSLLILEPGSSDLERLALAAEGALGA